MSERNLIAAAQTFAFGLIWLVLLVAVYRFGVLALLGSGSDMAIFLAIGVGAGGAIALTYLGLAFIRVVRRGLQTADKETES